MYMHVDGEASSDSQALAGDAAMAAPASVPLHEGVGGADDAIDIADGEGGSVATRMGSAVFIATLLGIVDLHRALRSSAVWARSMRCRNSEDGSSSKRLKRRTVEGRQQQQQRMRSHGRPCRAFGWLGTRSASSPAIADGSLRAHNK